MPSSPRSAPNSVVGGPPELWELGLWRPGTTPPLAVGAVVGATLWPFAIVVAGTVCAVAAVLVDRKGLPVVVGATLLPFAIVVADAVAAGAPIVGVMPDA